MVSVDEALKPLITLEQEESTLQKIFVNYSKFSYDKAREQSEKESEVWRTSDFPVWVALLKCIGDLSAAEKLYMNVSFLAPRKILRKENPTKMAYDSLVSELQRLEKRKSVPNPDKGNSEGFVSHICSQLLLFVKARLEMIAFYEKIVNVASGRFMAYEDLIADISAILTEYSTCFHHPVLIHVKENFMCEIEIMVHFLKSLCEMQYWRFLPALLNLHDGHTKLNSWHSAVQSKETKKYKFGGGFLKSSPTPLLYQWFWQARAHFLSKFSFYFYETLVSQTTPLEMKSLLAKHSYDYVAKIQSFQRKAEASSVTLFFHAEGIVDYKGPGYHLPIGSLSNCNQDNYPVVFSYPSLKEGISSAEQEKQRIVKQRALVLFSNPKNESYFYDKEVDRTFYWVQIDVRMTIVVIFDTQKPKKHNYINEFLCEMANQIRCKDVFLSLKPK